MSTDRQSGEVTPAEPLAGEVPPRLPRPLVEAETEDAIRAVVTRLSRPDRSGGSVIERAAILAEGAGSEAIIGWIIAHAGQPEAIAPPASTRGLHGSRSSDGGGAEGRPPRRYVLPAGVLT